MTPRFNNIPNHVVQSHLIPHMGSFTALRFGRAVDKHKHSANLHASTTLLKSEPFTFLARAAARNLDRLIRRHMVRTVGGHAHTDGTLFGGLRASIVGGSNVIDFSIHFKQGTNALAQQHFDVRQMRGSAASYFTVRPGGLRCNTGQRTPMPSGRATCVMLRGIVREAMKRFKEIPLQIPTRKLDEMWRW